MRIEPIGGRMNYIIGHNISALSLTDPIWLVNQTNDTIQEYCCCQKPLNNLQLVGAYLNSYYYSMLYITISQVPVGRSQMQHVLRVYAYTHLNPSAKHLVYEEASDPVPGTCDLEAGMSLLMMHVDI